MLERSKFLGFDFFLGGGTKSCVNIGVAQNLKGNLKNRYRGMLFWVYKI
jgi:hypothetical protein